MQRNCFVSLEQFNNSKITTNDHLSMDMDMKTQTRKALCYFFMSIWSKTMANNIFRRIKRLREFTFDHKFFTIDVFSVYSSNFVRWKNLHSQNFRITRTSEYFKTSPMVPTNNGSTNTSVSSCIFPFGRR